MADSRVVSVDTGDEAVVERVARELARQHGADECLWGYFDVAARAVLGVLRGDGE